MCSRHQPRREADARKKDKKVLEDGDRTRDAECRKFEERTRNNLTSLYQRRIGLLRVLEAQGEKEKRSCEVTKTRFKMAIELGNVQDSRTQNLSQAMLLAEQQAHNIVAASRLASGAPVVSFNLALDWQHDEDNSRPRPPLFRSSDQSEGTISIWEIS